MSDATPYHAEGGFWRAFGRPRASMTAPPVINPDPPVWPLPWGEYKPDASTTGPRPGVELTRVNGDFRVTEPGQVFENLEIFGRLIIAATAVNALGRNCYVRGPGTNYTGTSQIALVTAPSDFDLRGLTLEDCALDATGRENVYVDGVHGGNFTFKRVEIAGVQDGVSLKPAIGGQILEACWIHNGAYFEWLAGEVNSPSQDLQTHNDAIQFHRGRGVRIRGCRLGGYRAPGTPKKTAPYALDANRTAIIRANDDFNNAGIMLKQEVNSDPANKIDDVIIEKNWLEGGAAMINIAYSNGNNLAGVQIIDNVFARSSDPNQIYITKPDQAVPVLSGNVFEDNGAPVPIKRG